MKITHFQKLFADLGKALEPLLLVLGGGSRNDLGNDPVGELERAEEKEEGDRKGQQGAEEHGREGDETLKKEGGSNEKEEVKENEKRIEE